MSFFNKFKERVEHAAQFTAEKIGYAPADDTLKAERIEICNQCTHLFKPTRNCKLCGCFIDLKTKNQLSSCPIKKW